MLISIIIPTYNRAYLLERAVKSVFAQGYPSFKIIIVDDDSSDNTSEVVSNIRDDRIIYVRHDVNKGHAEARNTGFQKADGELIALLDSDDYWYPQKLTRQLRIFQDYKEASFIFTNGYYKKEGEMLFKTDLESGFIPQDNRHFPLKDILTLPSSWLFKREVVERIKGFDKNMPMWEDGDFFVRAARYFKVYFLNELLVYWYSPQENFDYLKELKSRQLFLQKHRDDMALDKDYYFRFLKTMGKDYLRYGEGYKARPYLYNALKLRPADFSVWGKLLRTFL